MTSRRQILIASVLSLLVPGAGHAYLRAWVRAVAWFAIAIATAALVIPESAHAGLESGSLQSILRQSMTLPLQVHAAVLVISVLSAIDASILVLRGQRRRIAQENAAGQCPNCGGDLDADLGFCPWCSLRIQPGADPDE